MKPLSFILDDRPVTHQMATTAYTRWAMEVFPVILLILGAVVAVAIRLSKRTAQAWQQAAASLGLQFDLPGRLSRPTLSGTIDGRNVVIDTYTEGSGDSSTVYTRYRVEHPSLSMGLDLHRQGMFSRVTKFFGRQDVDTGDVAFDDAFIVQADDLTSLRHLLTPSVRSGLLRLLAAYPGVRVSDTAITSRKPKYEKSPEVLESTARRIVAVSRVLTEPAAGVSDEAVVARQAGQLAAAATRLRELVDAGRDDVDTRLFEVETLAAAEDATGANRRLDELEELAPADPEVAGWRQALLAPPASDDRGAAGDSMTVVEDLFGGDSLSFETRARFDATYRGKSIDWEGSVKAIDPGPPGTATIAVATIQSDLYGNAEVDVIATVSRIPDGPAVGDTVGVTGRLSGIDPLVRNLFVEAAVINSR